MACPVPVPKDPQVERGRYAALRVEAAGGDAMAQALQWIEVSFGGQHRFKDCGWPCCGVDRTCCGCCGRRGHLNQEASHVAQ